ncbi:MAG: class I SAM-dependent methyltransferase [Reichenbachiella sp.]|uniref:class I SAM-dependent methyltransferase n=1 Tax=Reichenbachiella sp. TaxID=2184521 RepID=UPI003297A29E
MKGKLKTNTVDKYLRPIREQICNLVSLDAEVLEVGCGNGDLLFKLSSKIKNGLGTDIDKVLISYANERKEKEGAQNLNFKVADAVNEDMSAKTYDYAIVSLVFHVLKPEEAHVLLHRLMSCADQIIICAFCEPTSRWQRLLLWLDQRFSGHFVNFKSYAENGYMQGMLIDQKHRAIEVYDTFDPVIKVYSMKKSIE